MTQSVKLIFVTATNDLFAGADVSFLELIKDADRRGYQVHVVVPQPGNLNEELKRLGLDHSVIRYNYWTDNYIDGANPANVFAVDRFVKLIEEFKADSVITNTLNNPWSALASALTDRPHVWIAREYPIREFAYLKTRYDFVTSFSNLLIANSQSLTDYMQQDLGIKQTKQFRSFVDASQLGPIKESSTPRIVCLGNISDRKNQLELVKAVPLLIDKHPDIQVHIIGSPKNDLKTYETIKNYIDKKSLANNVFLDGHNELPFSVIYSSDILVQPSLSESVGRVIVEAMKLGLVCVGSDIDSNREAFSLGGGNLYKSGSSQDLAKVLDNILSDFQKYKQIAIVNQHKALKNLSRSACHDPFFEELESVMGQPNPRRELRHVVTLFSEASIVRDSYKQSELELKNALKQKEEHLQSIFNSRSWRYGRKIKRWLRP